MKQLVYFLISLFCIAGLHACNQKELDRITSQIDEMKSMQIASISSQISNIQASISTLEKMDAELKSSIDELSKKEEESVSPDEALAKEIASLKESLTQVESAMSKRIDNLKTYIDDEIKKQTDWITTTFSTLEQYQSTCNEIASVKLSVSDLENTLKGLITDSESSLDQKLLSLESTLKTLVSDTEASVKSWVNEQLTGYYTIAQVDAKVIALEKSIVDGDKSQAHELAKLKANLDSAKTDIKTAYELAISEAITTSDGKINNKIAEDIKTATDALQVQIDTINTKISEIELRLGKVEVSLEKIFAQVQSIVVVPTFSDGSVKLDSNKDTEILFEVSPRKAAIALAGQNKNVFSLDAISAETKASMFVVHFPIKSVQDNGECLVITIDAAQMDSNTLNSNSNLMARLKIDDGVSSMTTVYFTLSISYAFKPVDLGLSSGLKWADANLGANAPEHYGNYYAWGETETKSNYIWSTYKWANGSEKKLTKYCPADKADFWNGDGQPDVKTVLDSENDVAHALLGGKWRMPTDEEWTELRTQCTWTWTTENGVNGQRVTGPNENSIFLPAAGGRNGEDLKGVGTYGHFWSSSLDTDDPSKAWQVYFSSSSYPGSVTRSNVGRYIGWSIRPVSD